MNRLAPLLLAAPMVLLAAPTAWAQSGCAANPALCNLNVVSTIEQPDLDVAIDVVLVGDGFTSATAWQSAATSIINQFRSAPSNVYGRFPNLFNFHVVDVISATSDVGDSDLSDTALGMNVGGSYIQADGSRVNLAALNAPDVDVVIAVANSGSGRANANYNTQLASGGVVRMRTGGDVITHELGHALFHLADEYQEAALCNAQTESSLLLEANVTAEGSCYKFQGIAGAGCVQGGKYCSTGIYRSASSCVMRSNTGPACPACNQEMEDVLRERRSRADWAAPWVVGGTPGNGNPLAGTASFTAQSHDDYFTPTTFAFEIDGSYVGANAPAGSFGRLDFDTGRLSDGSHQLTVFGADAAGHAAAGRPLSFSTSNATDTTAPTVNISTPANGAVVSGLTSIFVQVPGAPTDLRDLLLFIDGAPVASSVGQTSLYYAWDLSAVSPGPHQLSARATDYSENVGSAPIVTVTASAAAGGRPVFPPQISRPRDGSSIGPWFSLEWSAEGTGGGVQGGGPVPVSLILDNLPLNPNPLLGRERSAVIDARTWATGPHQLRVRALISGVAHDSDPVLVVRGVPSTPEAFVRFPEAGATVRGTVSVGLAGADNVNLSTLTLLVNGSPAGSVSGGLGTVAWATGAVMGCPTLQAEALSSDGGTGRSDSFTVCVDNTPPTAAITWPHPGDTVAPGPLVVRAAVSDLGSYVTEVELRVDGTVAYSGPGNGSTVGLVADLSVGPHVLVVTATDRAGNTGSSASLSISAQSCISNGCDDGDACTTDLCGQSGACVHARIANCCVTTADCNDGDACTTDACNAGSCAHSTIPSCCNHPYDCDDGDLCTRDVCSGPGGTCSHPAGDCCSSAGDCNDGQACTTDLCVGSNPGFCARDWAPGCCTSNADCDDGHACTADVCSGGACTSSPIANCCETGSACNDGDSCTADLCINNSCQNQVLAGCCASDADCQTLNACAVSTCGSRGSCETTLTPGCCNFDFECDDTDPCTVHACSNHACTLVSPSAGCADAGVPDANPDASVLPDATVDLDASVDLDGAFSPDATVDVDGAVPPDGDVAIDAGPTDAALDAGDTQPGLDAAGLDAAAQDAGARDQGDPSDLGVTPANNEPLSGGCGCATVPSAPRPSPAWGFLLLLGLSARYRRRG